MLDTCICSGWNNRRTRREKPCHVGCKVVLYSPEARKEIILSSGDGQLPAMEQFRSHGTPQALGQHLIQGSQRSYASFLRRKAAVCGPRSSAGVSQQIHQRLHYSDYPFQAEILRNHVFCFPALVDMPKLDDPGSASQLFIAVNGVSNSDRDDRHDGSLRVASSSRGQGSREGRRDPSRLAHGTTAGAIALVPEAAESAVVIPENLVCGFVV